MKAMAESGYARVCMKLYNVSEPWQTGIQRSNVLNSIESLESDGGGGSDEQDKHPKDTKTVQF